MPHQSTRCLRSSPRGLTLLELLVVMVIVAFLLALAVIGIQASREVARRGQCTANLNRIGLALHAYHDIQGVFPLASNPRGEGPLVGLLPHLDQEELLEQLRMTEVPPTSPPVFHCPSDGQKWQRLRFGEGSYVGNYGSGDLLGGNDGFFLERPPWPDLEFYADQLGYVAAFSETSTSPLAHSHRIAEMPGDVRDIQQVHQFCIEHGEPTADTFYPTGRWIEGEIGHALYDHGLPPNTRSCVIDSGGGIFSAGSFHPGVANVLMADASARAVTDTIDVEIWRALGRVDVE